MKAWRTFQLDHLDAAHAAGGQLYHEFLRVPALSMGIYVLPAGADDPQSPHNEDEVYYVVSGRGAIQVDGVDQPVAAGSLAYVAAQVEHHFHSITEELRVLVLFAPAESE